ncbi:MAG: hypothetical protein ACM3O4_04745 [Ignavibacteriales bacterium]
MKWRKLSRRNKVCITFIIVNVAVLLLITCYYGARLVHYYRLENPKVKKQEALVNVVSLEKNLVIVGNGLYEKNGVFYYKGKDVNNYVSYSGRLWQIISVNDDNTVKMITVDNQTSIVWGMDNDYKNSYVREWLNPSNEEYSGIFYDTLYNPDVYIADSTWCIDVVDKNPNICEKTVKDKVGLLSISEYNRALGSASYLNIDTYWWTINGALDDSVWYVYPEGKVNNESNLNHSYYSYGVRPVINLKKDVKVYGGDGSKTNPYVIEPASNNVLNQKKVGEYIKYSDYIWRIADITNNYIKVYMDGFIQEDGKNMDSRFSILDNIYSRDKSMGKYLNTDFYNTLTNTDYLVESKWYTGNYDYSVDYDYKNIYNSSTTGKVGMLHVGSLFMEDYKDYFLMTRQDDAKDTIYKVVEHGKIFADYIDSYSHVRAAVNLKPNIVVKSGSGKKEDPYIIE